MDTLELIANINHAAMKADLAGFDNTRDVLLEISRNILMAIEEERSKVVPVGGYLR